MLRFTPDCLQQFATIDFPWTGYVSPNRRVHSISRFALYVLTRHERIPSHRRTAHADRVVQLLKLSLHQTAAIVCFKSRLVAAMTLISTTMLSFPPRR